MKTAGRENPNHGVAVPRNRAHGAVGQNRSCSIKWAAKQEKVRPWEGCFFLTSTFIELIRRYPRRDAALEIFIAISESDIVHSRNREKTGDPPTQLCGVMSHFASTRASLLDLRSGRIRTSSRAIWRRAAARLPMISPHAHRVIDCRPLMRTSR